MHKEVNDIVNVCDSILEKTQKINEISSEISKLARELEQNTEQADVPSKSLAMRKPLAALFILNSNLQDNIETFEKIYDELKRI